MTKQEQIAAWLARPIQVGDYINVKAKYKTTERVVTGRGKGKAVNEVETEQTKIGSGYVREIITDENLGVLYATEFNSWSMPSELSEEVRHIKTVGNYKYGINIIKAEFATPDISHCGVASFKKEPVRVSFYSQTIDSILSNCGYGRTANCDYNVMERRVINNEDPQINGKTYGGTNFDPCVIDRYGNTYHYQRGYVWNLEQKQALIESIYNWIEIGKFVFRHKGWNEVKKEIINSKDGHGHNFDCVDGKQRINAILEFVQNKFPDLDGNYWDDLSEVSQRRFLCYDRLAFGKMDEGTTDAMVISTFLNLNFTGVPMSEDHIKFVQSINI